MCEHTKSPLPNFFDSGLNACKYWLNPHFNGYIIEGVEPLVRAECFEVIAGIFPIQGELKCSDFSDYFISLIAACGAITKRGKLTLCPSAYINGIGQCSRGVFSVHISQRFCLSIAKITSWRTPFICFFQNCPIYRDCRICADSHT